MDENTAAAAAETGDGAADAASDPIKQVKSEFSRKFDNLNAELKAQNENMQAMLNQITQRLTPTKPSAPEKPVSELIFQDTDAAIARIKRDVKQEMTGEMQRGQGVSQVIMELTAKYPEFKEDNSEVSKLAVNISKTLPAHMQGTPEGARMAMQQAVIEQGLLPMNKRKTSDTDDFSLPGSTGTSAPRSQARKADEVDQKTLQLAQLLGVDIGDKKRLDGLKKASKRTNWNQFKGNKE